MTEIARATLPFLTFLEGLRAPWLEKIFNYLTYFGSEIALIALGMVLLWCVDKKRGYYALFVCLFGTILSQVLKLLCMVPRPWMLAPDQVHPSQSALGDASDYSFPSGHTQNSVGLFGSVAATSRRRIVRVLSVCMMILVPFSRMFLGVHTPLDIAFAAFLAALLLAALWPWYQRGDDRATARLMAAGTILCIAAAAFATLFPFSEGIDPALLAKGRGSIWSLAGAVPGIWIAFEVDRRHTRYSTEAPWYIQIVKTVVGLGLMLGLRVILKKLLGTSDAMNALRYFLMVGLVATFWPMTFASLAKLGRKGK